MNPRRARVPLRPPVPKSGGSPIALAMGEARPFAVDATTVYWCDQGVPPPDQTDGIVQVEGSIRSVPKGGGARAILASDGDTPNVLTLDEAGVIWHEARAIRRVPKSGGTPTTLSSQAIPWAKPVTW